MKLITSASLLLLVLLIFASDLASGQTFGISRLHSGVSIPRCGIERYAITITNIQNLTQITVPCTLDLSGNNRLQYAGNLVLSGCSANISASNDINNPAFEITNITPSCSQVQFSFDANLNCNANLNTLQINTVLGNQPPYLAFCVTSFQSFSFIETTLNFNNNVAQGETFLISKTCTTNQAIDLNRTFLFFKYHLTSNDIVITNLEIKTGSDILYSSASYQVNDYIQLTNSNVITLVQGSAIEIAITCKVTGCPSGSAINGTASLAATCNPDLPHPPNPICQELTFATDNFPAAPFQNSIKINRIIPASNCTTLYNENQCFSSSTYYKFEIENKGSVVYKNAKIILEQNNTGFIYDLTQIKNYSITCITCAGSQCATPTNQTILKSDLYVGGSAPGYLANQSPPYIARTEYSIDPQTCTDGLVLYPGDKYEIEFTADHICPQTMDGITENFSFFSQAITINSWRLFLTCIDQCGTTRTSLPDCNTDIITNNTGPHQISNYLLDLSLNDLSLQQFFLPTVAGMTASAPGVLPNNVSFVNFEVENQFFRGSNFAAINGDYMTDAQGNINGVLKVRFIIDNTLALNNSSTILPSFSTTINLISTIPNGSSTTLTSNSCTTFTCNGTSRTYDFDFPFNQNNFVNFESFCQFMNYAITNFKLAPVCGIPNQCGADDLDAQYLIQTFLSPNSNGGNACPDCFIPLSQVGGTVNVRCPGCATPGLQVDEASLRRAPGSYGLVDNYTSGADDGRAALDQNNNTIVANQNTPRVIPFRSIPGDVLNFSSTARFTQGAYSLNDLEAYWQTNSIGTPLVNDLTRVYFMINIPDGDVYGVNYLTNSVSCSLQVSPQNTTASGQFIINHTSITIEEINSNSTSGTKILMGYFDWEDFPSLPNDFQFYSGGSGNEPDRISVNLQLKVCNNPTTTSAGRINFDPDLNKSSSDQFDVLMFLGNDQYSIGGLSNINLSNHDINEYFLNQEQFATDQNGGNINAMQPGFIYSCGAFSGFHQFFSVPYEQVVTWSDRVGNNPCNKTATVIGNYKIGGSGYNIFRNEIRSPFINNLLPSFELNPSVQALTLESISDYTVLPIYNINCSPIFEQTLVSSPCSANCPAFPLNQIIKDNDPVSPFCNNYQLYSTSPLPIGDEDLSLVRTYNYSINCSTFNATPIESNWATGATTQMNGCIATLPPASPLFVFNSPVTLTPVPTNQSNLTGPSSNLAGTYNPNDGTLTFNFNLQNVPVAPNPGITFNNVWIQLPQALINNIQLGSTILISAVNTNGITITATDAGSGYYSFATLLPTSGANQLNVSIVCTLACQASGTYSNTLNFGWTCNDNSTIATSVCQSGNFIIEYVIPEISIVVNKSGTNSFSICNTAQQNFTANFEIFNTALSNLIFNVNVPSGIDPNAVAIASINNTLANCTSTISGNLINFSCTNAGSFTGTIEVIFSYQITTPCSSINDFPLVTLNATTACGSSLSVLGLYPAVTYNGPWDNNCNCGFTASITGPQLFCTNQGVQLTAIPNGGTGPYSYAWSGGGGSTATSNVLNASGTNTYTCTVTDAGGVSATASYTITGIAAANCCVPSDFTSTDLHFEASSLSLNSGLQAINKVTNTSFNGFGGIIVITGTITIDQDFEFYNCADVRMAPNAQIIVTNGHTLTVTNSYLHACANNLWLGIVAQPGATVVTQSTTVIEDALKAIEVQENLTLHAAVNSNLTTFNKNETAIYFNGSYGHSDFSTSHITGTTFTLYNPVLPPSGVVASNNGILISRGYNTTGPTLTIGGTSLPNQFDGGSNGIQIKESNVKIINAKFLNNRKGILINTLTDATPHHVVIGEANLGNIFEECIDYGVCIYADNVTISNNWFLRCQAPIVINQSSEQSYNIEGNNLQQARYGINLAYNKDLLVNINFNTISTVANAQGPNPYQGAAIRAYNASPCTEFTISNNYLSSQTTNAIIANNEYTGRLRVMSNVIINNSGGSTLPNTTGYNCIKLDACDGAVVYCNNLSNSQAIDTDGNAPRLSSNVAISQSKEVAIDCNDLNNSRFGLSYVGLCNQNKNLITGNNFNALNCGIYLGSTGLLGANYVEAIIDDQLTDANGVLPSNLFNGINGNFTTGGIYRKVNPASATAQFPPKFHYSPLYPLTFTSSRSSPVGVLYAAIMQIEASGTLGECANCGTSSPPAIDSSHQSMEAIAEAASENDNGNLFTDAVIKWLYQKELYKTLLNDSNILDSSAALAAYFEDLENTDLAKMAEVEQLEAALRDTVAALDSITKVLKKQQIQFLLDAMAAGNMITWNEKRVNEIFYEKIEKGLPMSSEEASDITGIAHQCPHKAGKAVYKARGIYAKIDPVAYFDDGALCNTSSSARQQQAGTDHLFIKLMPNPASTNVAILLSETDISMANVYLFDATGKQVLRKRIQNNEGNNSINVSMLTSGQYYCKVEVNGNTYYQSLTIVR